MPLTLNQAKYILDILLPKIYEWNNNLEFLQHNNFYDVDDIINNYNHWHKVWTGDDRKAISDEDRELLKTYAAPIELGKGEYNYFLSSMINPCLRASGIKQFNY